MTINARPNNNGNTAGHFRDAAKTLHLALRIVDEAFVLIASDVTNGRNYQTTDDPIQRHREDIERLDAARAARADLYDLVREILDAAGAE